MTDVLEALSIAAAAAEAAFFCLLPAMMAPTLEISEPVNDTASPMVRVRFEV